MTDQVPENIRPRPWQGYYTPELADRVFALYQRDFSALGYERSSWQTNRLQREAR